MTAALICGVTMRQLLTKLVHSWLGAMSMKQTHTTLSCVRVMAIFNVSLPYTFASRHLSSGGRPFHPSVPSSIHLSSSSWKKKMMEEEEEDDEWRQ
jgi:hypothetical protein